MKDLIAEKTSGLFVEVGKVIEHMKAQQARIADLERQIAEASAPAVGRQQWSHITPRDFVEVATAIMDQHGLMDGLSYEKTEKLCEAMEESFKKLPHPAPQAADTDKVREALDRLPAEIMNLRCTRTMSHFATTDDMRLYKEGHRDARHAAVELVLSAVWGAPSHEVSADWKLVPVAITEDMHVAAVKAIIRSTGNDDCPPNVWKAMLAAAPVASMAAQAPVREVPGYKLVPIKPTPKMNAAGLEAKLRCGERAFGRENIHSYDDTEAVFAAMLSAAPVQQEGDHGN